MRLMSMEERESWIKDHDIVIVVHPKDGCWGKKVLTSGFRVTQGGNFGCPVLGHITWPSYEQRKLAMSSGYVTESFVMHAAMKHMEPMAIEYLSPSGQVFFSMDKMGNMAFMGEPCSRRELKRRWEMLKNMGGFPGLDPEVRAGLDRLCKK